MAPILSGYVIDQFEGEVRGLTWGYRLILWSNIFAVIFLAAALCVAYFLERKVQRKEARIERRRKSESEQIDGVKPENAVDDTTSSEG